MHACTAQLRSIGCILEEHCCKVLDAYLHSISTISLHIDNPYACPVQPANEDGPVAKKLKKAGNNGGKKTTAGAASAPSGQVCIDGKHRT
jgi:hypothetical protein